MILNHLRAHCFSLQSFVFHPSQPTSVVTPSQLKQCHHANRLVLMDTVLNTLDIGVCSTTTVVVVLPPTMPFLLQHVVATIGTLLHDSFGRDRLQPIVVSLFCRAQVSRVDNPITGLELCADV